MNTALNKLRDAIADGKKASVKVGQNTVTLYPKERFGKSRWVLCWYVGRQRLTKESASPEVILDKAEEVLRAFDTGRAAVAALGEAKLSEYVAADTTLPGVSLRELIAFYEQHNGRVAGGITFAALAEAHKASVLAKGRRSRHLNTLGQHYTRAEKKFANVPIAMITVADLDAYLEGIGNLKTRLNHRISLISLFNFAKRKGHLPHDLPTAAEQTERPSPSPREVQVFTPAEAGKLLSAAGGDKKLKAFLLLGMFAGVRTAEIHRLQWKHVREDAIHLDGSITKTKRRRIAEMPENLRSWLKDLRGDPNEFVTYKSSTYLYKCLANTCAAAGVVWKDNAPRHSFVSYHLELHRDPSRTSKTAGHSLRILETEYLKLVLRSDAESWFNLNPNKTQETGEENAKPNGPGQNPDNVCRVGRCVGPSRELCQPQQHDAECCCEGGDAELRKSA